MLLKRLLPCFVALVACGGHTLASSETTSQPMIYLRGEGMEACGPQPAARGQWVSLQPGRLDESQRALVRVDAELIVTDSDGKRIPVQASVDTVLEHDGKTVTRARGYRTRFERTGTYRVTITLEDGVTSSRELVVVEQAGLRLGERGRQLHTQDARRHCTESMSGSPLSNLALNQALGAWLVPVDANGQPLIGDLELAFEGTIATRPEFPGTNFNRYLLEPTQPGMNSVSVTDLTLQQRLELTFSASESLARCPPAD